MTGIPFCIVFHLENSPKNVSVLNEAMNFAQEILIP